MTIDIDVYCKEKPEWHDLVTNLNWEEQNFLPDYDCFKWVPKGCVNHVYLYFSKKDPVIFSRGHDREIILDEVADAREKGFIIPDILLQKFEKDKYVITADMELHDIVQKHPLVVDALPWIREELGAAGFAQGKKLYTVALEAKQHAPKEVLVQMTGLASYFAMSFNGIIYEDQTNQFGKPDPEKLHALGMESFKAIAEDIKKKGHIIRPIDF